MRISEPRTRASFCALQRGAGSIESPHPATKPAMSRASSSHASSICRILCFLSLLAFAVSAHDRDDVLAQAEPGSGKITEDALDVLTLEENILRSLGKVTRHGSSGGKGAEQPAELHAAEVHGYMGGRGVAEATSQPQVDPDPFPIRAVVGSIPPFLISPSPLLELEFGATTGTALSGETLSTTASKRATIRWPGRAAPARVVDLPPMGKIVAACVTSYGALCLFIESSTAASR